MSHRSKLAAPSLAALSALLTATLLPVSMPEAAGATPSPRSRRAAQAASFAVHVYNEPGLGSVNSYWIPTRDGVVVIDGQRSIESANKLIGKIKAGGKPVAAIFLTHPHPDHFTGLAALKKAYPDAPIYALQGTRDSMATNYRHYFSDVNARIKADAPDGVPLPDHILAPGQEITIGGIRFVVEDIGAGEAEAMMMLHVPERNVLFSSDIIGNHMTPFLLESRLSAWLAQIDTVSGKYATVKTVYPGHGRSGSPSALLSAQKKYLLTFRDLVTRQMQRDGALTPSGKQAIRQAMQERYPGYLPVADIPDLLDKNIDAEADELKSPAAAP